MRNMLIEEMYFSKTDVNHIRVSMKRCSVQELADELGFAQQHIKDKIGEINAKDRIGNLAQG